uniref:TLC domain-containing protein n=1 Tax=Steinernema glaseri TaxID=37863 RepID=A0A1I8AGT1_9BILA
MHRHVFFCHSNITSSATAAETFLAYDIVIFDFGLMHRVLGTSECVANYLDGGYMRALWCVQHSSALMLMIFALYFFRRFVWLLWPCLLMQSSYALGMAVLTMATAPKLLEALSGTVDRELGIAFSSFMAGLSANWLFTFILWHYYWGMESKYATARRTL